MVPSTRHDRTKPAPRGRRIRAEDIAVGANVRAIRLRKGMSQTELGQALGVTFQQVQKYECGANRIGAGQLVRVAVAFKLPVQALFLGVAGSWSDDKAPPPITDPLALRAATAIVAIEDRELRRSMLRLLERLAVAGSKGDSAEAG